MNSSGEIIQLFNFKGKLRKSNKKLSFSLDIFGNSDIKEYQNKTGLLEELHILFLTNKFSSWKLQPYTLAKHMSISLQRKKSISSADRSVQISGVRSSTERIFVTMLVKRALQAAH